MAIALRSDRDAHRINSRDRVGKSCIARGEQYKAATDYSPQTGGNDIKRCPLHGSGPGLALLCAEWHRYFDYYSRFLVAACPKYPTLMPGRK